MLRNPKLFKTLALYVLMVFCSVTLTTGAMAEESPRVTRNEPQITASEPEPIPVVTESKVSTWTWIIGGALLVGGGVAAALSGGGGGSSSPAAVSKGSSTVTW